MFVLASAGYVQIQDTVLNVMVHILFIRINVLVLVLDIISITLL